MGTYLSFALLPPPTLLFVHCKTQNLLKNVRENSDGRKRIDHETGSREQSKPNTSSTTLKDKQCQNRVTQLEGTYKGPSSSTASPAVSPGTMRHPLQLGVCHFQTRQIVKAQTIKTRHPLTQQTAFNMHA